MPVFMCMLYIYTQENLERVFGSTTNNFAIPYFVSGDSIYRHGEHLLFTVSRTSTSSSNCPHFTAELSATHTLQTQCLFSSSYWMSRHTSSLLRPAVEGRGKTPPPRDPLPDIWTLGRKLDCPYGITFSSADDKQITQSYSCIYSG